MKKHLSWGIVAAAISVSSTSFAQETAPVPKANLQSSGTADVTPSLARKGTFDINANSAPAVLLLKTIAGRANLEVIASDEIQDVRTPVLRLQQIPAEIAIQVIAAQSGLSWGKAGDRTYLIVPNNSSRITLSTSVLPPRQNPAQRKEQPDNPAWKPFEFNGNRYYIIPLEKQESVQMK